MVDGDDAPHVAAGGGIGDGGSRGQGRFPARRHIADGKREHRGRIGGFGEPSTLYGREVLTDDVDFVDPGRGGDQRPVQLLDFGKGEGREQRRLHERGAAARKKDDDQSFRAGAPNQLEGGLSGEKALPVGLGMATHKILKVRAGLSGRRGRRDHATEFAAAREDGQKTIEHRVGGFADRENAQIREAAEIVATAGAAECQGSTGQRTFDGGRRIDGLKRALENPAGNQLRVVVSSVRHGGSIGGKAAPNDRLSGLPQSLLDSLGELVYQS